jgi:hypothetical protein
VKQILLSAVVHGHPSQGLDLPDWNAFLQDAEAFVSGWFGPVHSVAGVQVPANLDPRMVTAGEVIRHLSPQQMMQLKGEFPGVYLCMMLLAGDVGNEDTHGVAEEEVAATEG